MSFSLPVRVAAPRTLCLDPIFSLLYEDNEASLTHFLKNQAPLPIKGIINNPTVMDYLLSREAGPKVEYKNLRPALAALRPFLSRSANGKTLLAFYRKLLQLQGRWVIAAAEMVTFDMYTKLYQALFIDRNDQRLLDHIVKVVPNAAQIIATKTTCTAEQFALMVQDEKERLAKDTRAAAEKLFDYKVTNEFFQQHGKLLASIEICEKQFKAARARLNRRRQEAMDRRAAGLVTAYERNIATLPRQMGMAGMTPSTAEMEQSVIEWAQKAGRMCFNTPDIPAATTNN
ncbi:hypothetical protein HRR83_003561 [Exophiala dermatitidis]|uniref:Uncharacterized protein n=2 Tax=Exophiala dermatitidis TaxID=5970 RepID=H6BSE5_EXODN